MKSCLMFLTSFLLLIPLSSHAGTQRLNQTKSENSPSRQTSSGSRQPCDFLLDDAFGLNISLPRLSNAPASTSSEVPDELGPAFYIGGDVAYGPAPDMQQEAAIAFDGTTYMVVWCDNREGNDIYGARVTSAGAGVLLDQTGIPISTAVGCQTSPAIAFNGTDYLVVWVDYRNGSQGDIYAARVSPSGKVLDPEGIVISSAPGSQLSPAIAFDGADYLVVWQDARGGDWDCDIYGSRVSPSGVVLDVGGIAISTAPGSQAEPAVAFGGTNYLVVWGDTRSGWGATYCARVSVSGSVLDSTGIGVGDGPELGGAPSVASDGNIYLVVWDAGENDCFGYYGDILGRRVSQSGTLIDSTRLVISDAAGGQMNAAAVFNGTDYVVVWTDHRDGYFIDNDIYASRVSPSGIVRDPDGIMITSLTSKQQFPAIASNSGGGCLVVWEDWDRGFDIWGARVDSFGVVLDPDAIAISTAAASQTAPVAAFDGTNYMLVWTEERAGDEIYGSRVSSSGDVLDQQAIPIAAAPGTQWFPDICFGASQFVVVWQRYSGEQIYGARVSSSVAVLDSAGILLSGFTNWGEWYPDVAFDGTNYFTVWHEPRSVPPAVVGVRLSPLGEVVGPGIGLPASAGSYDSPPAIAFDGTNYLVVWADERNWPGRDVYCARVNPSGQILDPDGSAISTAREHQFDPAVAFDGDNYFVVWTDSRAGSYESGTRDIYGARITPSGTVIDTAGIVISNSSGAQVAPSIAFDGTNYLVVWMDSRNSNWRIYGARVTPSGIVLDPNGFAMSSSGEIQTHPSVTKGPVGQLLIVYSSFMPAPEYGAYRTWGNLWTSSTTIQAHIEIDPKTLNTRDGGRWITCHIELPDGNDVEEIDVGSVRINGSVPAEQSLSEIGDYDGDSHPDLMLKFDRSVVTSILPVGDDVLVTVTGKVGTEQFVGVDHIRVIASPNAASLEVSPNPYRLSAHITYAVPGTAKVVLRIWNVEGHLVRTLENTTRSGGVYATQWDGTDEDGRQVSSGLYFCRLEIGQGVVTRKLALLR
jgi:hypothetical protein